MSSIIDSHHHLWRFNAADYSWIEPGMTALRRDFLADDLVAEMAAAGVDGSVAVQARQSVEETAFLLAIAEATPKIRGVVGWVPLREPDVAEQVEAFSRHLKLRGFRHVVQDEPENDFILGDSFNRGIRTLTAKGLVYDLLVRASQLPATIRLVQKHPDQVFVLDHLAKPSIRTGTTQLWEQDFRDLAKCPNVSCKVSGLVTEANWSAWSEQDIVPYMNIALEAFGPHRLMAGSDWPVCLLASSYGRWWSLLFRWTDSFAQDERSAMLGGTATRVYGLTSGE